MPTTPAMVPTVATISVVRKPMRCEDAFGHELGGEGADGAGEGDGAALERR